jgi:hypothetical protein
VKDVREHMISGPPACAIALLENAIAPQQSERAYLMPRLNVAPLWTIHRRMDHNALSHQQTHIVTIINRTHAGRAADKQDSDAIAPQRAKGFLYISGCRSPRVTLAYIFKCLRQLGGNNMSASDWHDCISRLFAFHYI